MILISNILNSFLFLFLELILGSKILNEKINYKNIINIIIMFLYVFFLVINAFVIDKLIKTFYIFILLIFMYKIIFRKDWMKSICVSIIMYFMILLSEIIVTLLFGILSYFFNINIINSIEGSFLANLLIFLTIISIYKLYDFKLKKLCNYLELKDDKIIAFIFLLLIVIFSLILNKYRLINWIIDFQFVINILILVILLIILLILIFQKKEYNKFLNRYRQLTKYSELTDKVLEEYRLKNHEYKNQLIIIKTLIDKNKDELKEYVDNLISINQMNQYQWINNLKNINLTGLKGLINYKIIEATDKNIKYNLIVSNELLKIDFNNLNMKEKDQLYTIIGVYLDNSNEAANLSLKKEIFIDISIFCDEVKIMIGNSYEGLIKESKLNNFAYSTKGKNRGIGLYLVDKIISNSDKFRVERIINDNYFIQILYIKTK